MKKLLLITIIISVAATSALARPVEHYFRFTISDRSELETLTRTISISDVRGDTVWAYANGREMAAFEQLGYTHTQLQHPGTLIEPEMALSVEELADWDSYPSYGDYVAMMYQFQTDYPNLCRIINAGSTVEGRAILFAKISDNVDIAEDEPEVLYTSSMHGDELTGYVLMLRMIDSLLSTYGTEPGITDMVDNLEIWINPLANPDGTYITGDISVSGAIRYNANSVDLNRNFPDPDNGDHPDGNPWQPETIVMMDFAAEHNFVISANFHGGAEVLNYPWDTWSRPHPDDIWFQTVCHTYADTAQAYSPISYLDGFDDGITNGYDWYPIAGGRQDFMNYWHHCREVTMEISQTKLLPASSLPDHWNYNHVALFQYLRQALYGIRGVVTDAYSGAPVGALVTVLDHDLDEDSSQVYCDIDIGDYHRMLSPGTYDLEFSADGYLTQQVFGVTVTEGGIAVRNIEMVPDSFVCGDVNAIDGLVSGMDLVYFVNYLFNDGPPPPHPEVCDVNSSGFLSGMDLVYLVNYLFNDGPAPNCP